MAVAAGVAYDIKSDDLTITPKAGIRYANTAYTENGVNGISPLSNKPLFETGYGKMGLPGKAKDDDDFRLASSNTTCINAIVATRVAVSVGEILTISPPSNSILMFLNLVARKL